MHTWVFFSVSHTTHHTQDTTYHNASRKQRQRDRERETQRQRDRDRRRRQKERREE